MALGVEELEQLLARQVLAALNDPGQPPVDEGHRVADAALAPEGEPHLVAFDPYVPFSEGREAEGLVVAGVLVVADPDQGLVEQAHHRRENLASSQVGSAKIPLHLFADAGQQLTEFENPAELGLVRAAR